MANAEITEDGGIITVTFDRPDKHNAIDAPMTEVLWEATNALADRDDLRCMVLTGKGRYFTSGVDLSSPVGNRPGYKASERRRGWDFRRNYRSHHLLYDEFENIEKPIVVAAQGICLGAGLEMAVSCDFRFCTPETEFGVPEVHIGVIAGSGGTSRLTRLVGPAWGKWMAMAGQRVSAERALQIGLVHQIFDSATFLEEVYAFCRGLLSMPAESLGVAKLAVDMYADVHDRTVQRHVDRLIISGMVDSPDLHGRGKKLLEGSDPDGEEG